MTDEQDRAAWSSGHRSVPHTADVRVEAWAPTRELCVAEAVAAVVESFLETPASTRATGAHVCRLTADSDDDLLVAVLDEVVYLLDTAGKVPIDVEIQPLEQAVDVRFEGEMGQDDASEHAQRDEEGTWRASTPSARP